MRLNKTLLAILLALFLFDIVVLARFHSINQVLNNLQKGAKTFNGSDQKIEPQLQKIQREVSNLNNGIDRLRENLVEIEFFSKNERKYELGSGRFILNYCCIFFEGANIGYLGYDFLLEIPPGSGDLYDFGTTSYIKFISSDVINSFNVVAVGNLAPNPIYKVKINSEYRYTEGIVYPKSDPTYGFSYERLYEVKNDDFDYHASVTAIENGYIVTVSLGLRANEVNTGEYVLTLDGEGYAVKIIKNVNASTKDS